MTPITAKGTGGTVTFDGTFVTIQRTGLLAHMTIGKGEKRIPIGSITAVQWKPPGAMVNGFIQFTIAGSNKVRSQFGRQSTAAAKDENSVLFTKQQLFRMEMLRSAVEKAIAHRHVPTAPGGGGMAVELGELAKLHQSGALSAEEYAAAKARLIGS